MDMTKIFPVLSRDIFLSKLPVRMYPLARADMYACALAYVFVCAYFYDCISFHFNINHSSAA